MFCKKCGARLGENAKFCKGCGVKVIEVSQQKAAPTSQDITEVSQKQETPVVHKKRRGRKIATFFFCVIILAGVAYWTYTKYFLNEEQPAVQNEISTTSPAVETGSAEEVTSSAVSVSTSVISATEVPENTLGMVTNIVIQSNLNETVSFDISWDEVEEADGYEVYAYIKLNETSVDYEFYNVYHVNDTSFSFDTHRDAVYGVQVRIKALQVTEKGWEDYGIEGQSSIANTFSAVKAEDLQSQNNIQEQDDPTAEEVELSSEYIFPNSDKEYLTQKDIKGMSFKEVNLAKNELYARHGYIFKKGGEVRKYFESKSWYHPSISSEEFAKNGDGYYFNKYEIANRNLLVKRERKLKK